MITSSRNEYIFCATSTVEVWTSERKSRTQLKEQKLYACIRLVWNSRDLHVTVDVSQFIMSTAAVQILINGQRARIGYAFLAASSRRRMVMKASLHTSTSRSIRRLTGVSYLWVYHRFKVTQLSDLTWPQCLVDLLVGRRQLLWAWRTCNVDRGLCQPFPVTPVYRAVLSYEQALKKIDVSNASYEVARAISDRRTTAAYSLGPLRHTPVSRRRGLTGFRVSPEVDRSIADVSWLLWRLKF